MPPSKDLNKSSKNILAGYIKLYGSVRNHPRVGFVKPFKYSEAWQWILFEIGPCERVKKIKHGRGCRTLISPAGGCVHSFRFIAEAWGWRNKNTVQAFLKALESDGSIVLKIQQGFTQIEVVNWEKYRSNDEILLASNMTTNGPIETTTYENELAAGLDKLQSIYKEDITNNSIVKLLSKKEKMEILDRRAREFWEQLDEFKGKYKRLMLEEFWNHWTEPNRSLTKLKFEMQPTWDIAKRLVKWKSNEEKWYGKADKRNTEEIQRSAKERLARVFGLDD